MITKKNRALNYLALSTIFLAGSCSFESSSAQANPDETQEVHDIDGSCQDYEYISEYFKEIIASINATAILERLNGPGIIGTLMEELE